MRINDVLHFSPKYKFVQVNDFIRSDDYPALVAAFRDRVEGFYLEPARYLIEKGYGFAAGILCWCTIEFLSVYKFPNADNDLARIKRWLSRNVRDFAEGSETPDGGILADSFYKDFRCGLVHEGRIKGLGQFSFEIDTVVDASMELEDFRIVVNPELLLKRLEVALNEYCEMLCGKDPSHVRRLVSTLKETLGLDLDFATRASMEV